MSPSKSERIRNRLSIDPDAPDPAPAPEKAPEGSGPTAADETGTSAPIAPSTDAETTSTAAVSTKTPASTSRARRKPGTTSSSRTRKAPAKETPAAVEPRVLRPASTAEAERSTLYLHPDDHRELVMARLEDKADANTRIRAMIALWRANPRYRAAVDKLARTTPRGGNT